MNRDPRAGETSPVYAFGPFRLDPAERTLLRDGQPVALTPKAFDLLAHLVERHGRLVEKTALMSALWPDTVVEEANIAYNISALRKALGNDGGDAKFIETVPTRGYRFVAPVTTLGTASEPALDRPVRWHATWWFGVAALALVCGIAGWIVTRANHSAPTVNDDRASGTNVILRRLTAAPSEMALESAAISPDGKYLAYSDPTGVKVQTIDTGETHRISDVRATTVFGWTADGTRIRIFDRSQIGWDIALVGGAWQRSGLSWPDGSISIAPDATCLLSVTDGEVRLNPAQGQPRSVLRLEKDEAIQSASWTPDDKRVLFVRGNGARLESFATRGGDPTPTYEPCGDQMIRWVGPVMPDGRVILLVGSRKQPDDIGLYELRVDTRSGAAVGRPHRLTEWREGRGCLLMSASADGRRVVLLAGTRQQDVYIASFDKQNGRIDTPRRLTFTERDEDPSAWLPDNKTVILGAAEKGPQRDVRHIVKQAIDSATAVPLVSGEGYRYLARLTPDERWLLFIQNSDPNSAIKNTRVMRVPVEGGLPQEIASSPGLAVPQCSVVARCILYERRNDGIRTLYELDPMKGRGGVLATLSQPMHSGYISPDGSEFNYVVEDSEPANRIRTISFEGKPPREIVVRAAHNLENLDPLANGSGWFSVNHVEHRDELLFITRDGHSRVLWAPVTPRVLAAIPSPDGKHLAIQTTTHSTNAWMLTGF